MVRLSDATMAKQSVERGRVELGAEQYRLAARIIAEPLVLFRERGNHLVMFGEDANGLLYKVVVKTTADRSENYIASLHRSDARRIRAKLRGGRSELIFDRRPS